MTRYAGSSPLTRGKHDESARARERAGLIPTHAGKTAPRLATKRARRAHPHSRGENSQSQRTSGDASGSSPLTRGKRDMLWQQAGRTGLIPTHAGKTHARDREPHQHEAHPHSRGENSAMASLASLFGGSSPLTRGKPNLGLEDCGGLRLIPTHAGKTTVSISARPASRAHPHSRGENFPRVTESRVTAGSSPLTRGKPRRPAAAVLRARLIPTHAGKTMG